MVKKAPQQSHSSRVFYEELKSMSKPKRNKSVSDERMKSGSSDNDTMNSPEYGHSAHLLPNTMKVYEEVHPYA